MCVCVCVDTHYALSFVFLTSLLLLLFNDHRDTADVKTLLRHGYFTMYPDFASTKDVLPTIVKKATAALKVGPVESLNVLHIGFATHSSNDVSTVRCSCTVISHYTLHHFRPISELTVCMIVCCTSILRTRALHRVNPLT